MNLCKELLAHLPDRLRPVFIRANSGFFADELFTFLESAQVRYTTKAKLHSPLLLAVLNLPNEAWRKSEPGLKIATLHFGLQNWPKRRKFVATRKAKAESSNQPRLFDEAVHEYQDHATNIHREPLRIARFCRKGGTAERDIREIKYYLNVG